MLLSPHDAELFFKLHRSLMFYVNERLTVISDKLSSPEGFAALPAETRLKVRDALSANLRLIESFVGENPFQLSDDELEIVRSWRPLVAGKFHVFRELKKHTLYLSIANPPIAYGVLALTEPFEYVIGAVRPRMVSAVLLPLPRISIETVSFFQPPIRARDGREVL